VSNSSPLAACSVMMEALGSYSLLLHVHDQRDVFEEAFHGLELVHGADQLFQVFQPGRRFGVLVLLVHLGVAGLVQNDLGNLGVGQGGDLHAPAVKLAEQVGQRLARLGGQLFGGTMSCAAR
jgi:hypothetical protein